LLIIAIRMIFAGGAEVYANEGGREPSVFPLAVPLLAGPSAMAKVLLLASRQSERLWSWVGALTLAMAVSGSVLLAADRIRRWLAGYVDGVGDQKADGAGADRGGGGDDPGRSEKVFFRPQLRVATGFRSTGPRV